MKAIIWILIWAGVMFVTLLCKLLGYSDFEAAIMGTLALGITTINVQLVSINSNLEKKVK